MTIFRRYDNARDLEASHRIWKECGWLEDGKEAISDLYRSCGSAFVAEVGGEAECLVTTAPGTVRYLTEDVPFSCVTGVTTSRLVRKQGLAARLAAMAVAQAAAEGAMVSGLGMFEQGYYNQLGFGTGSYAHFLSFDPASLQVPSPKRTPRRLHVSDNERIHRARLARRRKHGSCNLIPPEITLGDIESSGHKFGLGYGEGDELTHLLWFHAENVEPGPYRVALAVYRTMEQFLELMGLIKSLGDQVHLVKMEEPPGIQLQDLIRQPFKQRRVTEKSAFASSSRAVAWWQMRLCDVPGCVAKTRLRGDETIRFNLELHDPITTYLEEIGDGSGWRGVGGDYMVTFGRESGAEPGRSDSLPTLTASVGAFTRLWLGVLPAAGLAATDRLSGPAALLEQLDASLCLPVPHIDWNY